MIAGCPPGQSRESNKDECDSEICWSNRKVVIPECLSSVINAVAQITVVHENQQAVLRRHG